MMNTHRLVRPAACLAALGAALALLAGCAGSPEATAQWYLSDKPADMRVPVSGQTDPGAQVSPADE
mgnify:CR=1 FL=1